MGCPGGDQVVWGRSYMFQTQYSVTFSPFNLMPCEQNRGTEK